MKIRQLMHQECAHVRPSDSLSDAVQIMSKRDCGALPVVDADNVPVGMVTDRDICLRAHERDELLKELKVEGAMSSNLVTCAEDDEVAAAQRLMSEGQIRRLPVVDAKGRLTGVLTLAQIARAGLDQKVSEVDRAEVGKTLAAICRPSEAPSALA